MEDLEFFQKSEDEIEKIEIMTRTEGWQEIAKRLREELRVSILQKVQGDDKITTLLKVLAQADTRSAKELLEAEINDLVNNR